jgi:hypothetical protein
MCGTAGKVATTGQVPAIHPREGTA